MMLRNFFNEYSDSIVGQSCFLSLPVNFSTAIVRFGFIRNNFLLSSKT